MAGEDIQGAQNTGNMAFLSFFQLVALFTLYLQAQYSSAALLNRGICATEDPDESLLSELQRLKSNETQSDPTAEARLLPIEIDTWFHIIRSEAETDQVSEEMVAAQVCRSPFHLHPCRGVDFFVAFDPAICLHEYDHLISIARRDLAR